MMALTSPLNARKLTWAAAITGWLTICALEISNDLSHPGVRGLILTALTVIGPFLLLNMARLPVYVLAAYAILVPFNDLLSTTGGPTVTRLLAMLSAGSLAFLMLVRARIVKPSYSVLATIALSCYLSATVFWAIDPNVAMAAFAIYVSQAALFVAIALYPFSRRDLVTLLAAVLLGALVQSVYGDYLFLHGQEMFGTRLYIGSNAAQSIDPNAFAAGLIAPLALVVTLFMRARLGLLKVGLGAVLVTMFGAFIVSGSRGAAMGFIVTMTFLIWRSRYRAALMGAIAVAAIAIATSPLGQRFLEPDVANANGRMDIWKVGVSALGKYWLGGAGVGNFNNAFMQFYLTTPHMWLAWDRVAHSIFLQFAVEGGIFGFVLFLVFWVCQFRELSNVPRFSEYADICAALQAGVLGVFVAGFGLDVMDYKYTWLLFSLIAIMRTVLRGLDVPLEKEKRNGFSLFRAVVPASGPVSTQI